MYQRTGMELAANLFSSESKYWFPVFIVYFVLMIIWYTLQAGAVQTVYKLQEENHPDLVDLGRAEERY